MSKEGISNLPDGSQRYLVTAEKLNAFLQKHNLLFVEPLKTVNVNELRFTSNLTNCKSVF